MSTMRRPVAVAIRAWRESAAGIDAAPGSVTARAPRSRDVIVDAVPIVMQWPGERAMPFSISSHASSVSLPARFSAQYFQMSEPRAERTGRCQSPRSIGPAGMKIAGRFMLIAPISSAGVVLSQPPISTRAVGRIGAQQLLGLHREQVAVEHRRRLLERLGERDRRHLDREAAGLPDAALHLLGALAEVRVARVDVAPRVDDRDHRLAEVVAARVAHLRGARAVAECRACRPCRTSGTSAGLPGACVTCGDLLGADVRFVRRFRPPGHYSDGRRALRPCAPPAPSAPHGRICRTCATCDARASVYSGPHEARARRAPRRRADGCARPHHGRHP